MRHAPQPLSDQRPQPIERWWLRNRWEELTFLHWRYPADVLRPLVPDELDIDTFDGSAWVSLIPFRMVDAAPRGVPAIPWVSSFAETNVRTYVVDSHGHRAIWFFSLEASRLAVAAFARLALGFPYVWSDMTIDVSGARRRYETFRRRWPTQPASTTRIVIDVGSAITEPNDLDVFLTGRWGTVARWPGRRGRLRHHPVDHARWDLSDATLVDLDDESITAAGLPAPRDEPIVRWARPLSARFGRPQLV